MKEPHRLTRETRAPVRPVDKLVQEGDGLYRPCGAKVDLHTLLTDNNPSVYLMPVYTNIMRASGLHHGGIAVINRAGTYRDGALVAVRYNGDTVIRHLKRKDGHWYLTADDPRVQSILISPDDEVERLGVVRAGITFTD